MGSKSSFQAMFVPFQKYRKPLDFEGWYIRKRECFCQSFDLWDTYLIKPRLQWFYSLTEWKHNHAIPTKLLWANNVFYFVFKLWRSLSLLDPTLRQTGNKGERTAQLGQELRYRQILTSPPLSEQISAARLWVLIQGPAAMWVAEGCWNYKYNLTPLSPQCLSIICELGAEIVTVDHNSFWRTHYSLSCQWSSN